MAYGARACAVSRTVVSPAQPGETERSVSGSTADRHRKMQGTRACRESGDRLKTSHEDAPQDPRDRVKAGWLEASSPIGVTRPCRNGVRHRHPGVPWYGLATEAPSPPGALAHAVRQGDAWAPYVTLGRTTGGKHGIAYGREPMATEPPEESWASRPTTETGTPHHRAKGGRGPRCTAGEVRERRTAANRPEPHPRTRHTRMATGRPLSTTVHPRPVSARLRPSPASRRRHDARGD